MADLKVDLEILSAKALADFKAKLLGTINEIKSSQSDGNLFKAIVGGDLVSAGIQKLTGTVVSGGAAILDYSSNLEQATIGMTTMIGSADQARKHLQDLQDFAKTTPFEFKDLVTASQKFQGVGIEAERIIPIMEAVGNSLAAAGRIAELPFATKAISDIVAKGRLQGQEVIQLSNAGIPALKILSEALKRPQEEILKLGEDGRISSELFLAALDKYSKQNFGSAMLAQSRTFAGAMSNVTDVLYQTSQKAFDPLYDKISGISVSLADQLSKSNDFGDVAAVIAKGIARGFGELLSEELAREIKDLREGKGDPFKIFNENVNVGVAASEGFNGGRGLIPETGFFAALAADARINYKAKQKVIDPQFALQLADLPDLKAANIAGRYDDWIKELEDIRDAGARKLLAEMKTNPAQGTLKGQIFGILSGLDPATPAADVPLKLGLSAADIAKEAKQVAEAVKNFKIAEVDSYVALAKDQIDFAANGDQLQLIRETANLEQDAYAEKIRLQKEFYADQAKAMSAEDLQGTKGKILALEALKAVNGLEREAEAARIKALKAEQDELQKRAETVKKMIQDVRGAMLDAVEDNPLVKMMVDFGDATDRAAIKFKGANVEFINQMADLDRQVIQRNINKGIYDNEKSALKAEQEARRLELEPLTSRDQFQQRLQLSNARIEFAAEDRQLMKRQTEALYYAGTQTEKSFNQSKYSTSELARLGKTREDQDRAINIKESLADIAALRGADVNGTGAFGRELIADKILSLIPDANELRKQLRRSTDPSLRSEAQSLFGLQAESLEQKRESNAAKLREQIEQARFKNLAIRDAEEQLRNINGLTDKQSVQEFLAITGELGNENLTANLRAGRVAALKEQAAQQRAEKKDAADQAKRIDDVMKIMRSQMENQGLRVKSDVPIVEIQVNSSDLGVTQRGLGTRASQSDTRSISE